MNVKILAILVSCIITCGIVTAGCPCNGVSNTIFPFNPSGCADMPRLPHTFGGCALINGEPAPIGTYVSVSGNGVAGNTINVNANGCFGMGTFDPKLMATGLSTQNGMINVQEGTDLRFYVNGQGARVCIGSTCSWFTQYHTGHHTYVTLLLEVPECCNN